MALALVMAAGVLAQSQEPSDAPPVGALAPANIAKPRPKPPFDLTGTWFIDFNSPNSWRFGPPPPANKLTPQAQVPVATAWAGDVYARALVRWVEVQRSLEFVEEQLNALPVGEPMIPCGEFAPHELVVALEEGWRGEVSSAGNECGPPLAGSPRSRDGR